MQLFIPSDRILHFCTIYRRPQNPKQDWPTLYGCGVPFDLFPDDDMLNGIKVMREHADGTPFSEPFVNVRSRMPPPVEAYSDRPLTEDQSADLLRRQLDRLDARNSFHDRLFYSGRPRVLTVEPYDYKGDGRSGRQDGRGLALTHISVYLKEED